MEENRKLESLLEKQMKYTKWQCILTAAAAVGCVGVFLLMLSLIPQLSSLTLQVETVLTDLEGMTVQTETILTNLDTVASELAQVDLKGMVEDVDAFVTTGQNAVEQATEKLSIIDFETLNRAIQNLADVVEPLAGFFNIFN